MKIEKKTLTRDGLSISYTLHIKKVKNITLRISEEGTLLVTCNAFVPQSKIDAFVFEKAQWILQKQQKMLQKQQMDYEDVISDDYFYLFGKRLTIVRIQSNQNKICYDHENLYVYYKEIEDAHKYILRFIRKVCEQSMLPLVDMYYEKLKDYRFMYPTVKFRKMKSRWGSCIPSKAQITLNERLIHYDERFMEYVVLHELVHFIQPNHSASFYQVIQYHMPDYKQRMQLVR
ncbi:MAG: M48 family peptidase [Erysipelotrichia bacterium]|nr:M48 family peptidase [Erysipelotrichia bacterium]